MTVEVRSFATFREAIGEKSIDRDYDDMTVRDALEALESEFDGLAGELLEGDGVRPHVNVLLDGREVAYTDDGLETVLEDGDRISVFPPVAGGATREKAFRGISMRLARRYLENLGGTVVDDETVESDEWTASLSAESVNVGGSLSLTEITVRFEGDDDVLEDVVERFSRKAMRAGG